MGEAHSAGTWSAKKKRSPEEHLSGVDGEQLGGRRFEHCRS
jgi:hypothetical protein